MRSHSRNEMCGRTEIVTFGQSHFAPGAVQALMIQILDEKSHF